MSSPRFPDDIFTEPEPDHDTLAHLGPLAPLAGSWSGEHGVDVHPAADGTETDGYTETWVLDPIDAQTNGPQLLYGLRYHQRVVKKGGAETFHDQVGYLLWEPERGRVLMTLAIPRGQVAMAVGDVAPDATGFTLVASEADRNAGISSNDFLDFSFRTTAWTVTIEIEGDDAWSYRQTTMLDVRGRGSFAHTDTGALVRTAPPTPNPLAAQA